MIDLFAGAGGLFFFQLKRKRGYLAFRKWAVTN
jgi:hypothetical protein